ncbi:MAG: hypothetical protein ACM35G_11440, partial [Planctomycetaceae bacterium]
PRAGLGRSAVVFFARHDLGKEDDPQGTRIGADGGEVSDPEGSLPLLDPRSAASRADRFLIGSGSSGLADSR